MGKKFQAFYRIAIAAPRLVRNSLEFFGLGTLPFLREFTIQWIKRCEPQAVRQGANDGLIACLASAPGNSRQGNEQVGFLLTRGTFAQDMKSIADLGFFQVAQESVEPLQIVIIVAGKASVLVEFVVACKFKDLGFEDGETTIIQACGQIIFVD